MKFATVSLRLKTFLSLIFKPFKNKTMSRTQKILVDFNQFTNADLVAKVQTVISSLTGSTVITTPQPTIAQLQTGLDDLTDSMAAAETGGKAQKQLRDQKRSAMIALMKQEAVYVGMVASGDVAVMLDSGFDVSKIPSPIGALPKPVKFVVSSPQKGWLQLSLQRIYGARNYQFEYKKPGDTQWTIVCSVKAKIIIQGLDSAAHYIGRVLPIGTSTEKTYSDEISAVVI